MNYYIDITVLPDPEFKATVLMSALFSKCHRALGQYADQQVGVSFPQHKQTLGPVLRLHGNEQRLNDLMQQRWLKGLSDYTKLTDIKPIPEKVRYRTVAHIRKKSAHNKRQRAIRKGRLTETEAFEKFRDDASHLLQLPFAELISLSNGSRYRVFIQHGELQDQWVDGDFSSYGLSKTATIPWF